MSWKECVLCGKQTNFRLHGLTLKVPMCKRCAYIYASGLAMGERIGICSRTKERDVTDQVIKIWAEERIIRPMQIEEITHESE